VAGPAAFEAAQVTGALVPLEQAIARALQGR
jgi:hypothetical protein